MPSQHASSGDIPRQKVVVHEGRKTIDAGRFGAAKFSKSAADKSLRYEVVKP